MTRSALLPSSAIAIFLSTEAVHKSVYNQAFTGWSGRQISRTTPC